MKDREMVIEMQRERERGGREKGTYRETQRQNTETDSKTERW